MNAARSLAPALPFGARAVLVARLGALAAACTGLPKALLEGRVALGAFSAFDRRGNPCSAFGHAMMRAGDVNALLEVTLLPTAFGLPPNALRFFLFRRFAPAISLAQLIAEETGDDVGRELLNLGASVEVALEQLGRANDTVHERLRAVSVGVPLLELGEALGELREHLEVRA
jgi:hypothetical protein